MMLFADSKDLPVVAEIHTTIHRSTSISKALEVVGSILGPLGLKLGTLRLVAIEVADGVLLGDVTLKVDVGPGGASVLLHGDEVNTEATLAELLLELDVVGGRNSLDEHLDSLFEVVEVALIGSLGQKNPSFVLSLVGDVVHVDLHLVLAVDGVVTLLLAVLAHLRLGGAVTSLMTFLVAGATGTGEDTRLGALGLSMAFLTLGRVSVCV